MLLRQKCEKSLSFALILVHPSKNWTLFVYSKKKPTPTAIYSESICTCSRRFAWASFDFLLDFRFTYYLSFLSSSTCIIFWCRVRLRANETTPKNSSGLLWSCAVGWSGVLFWRNNPRDNNVSFSTKTVWFYPNVLSIGVKFLSNYDRISY